VTIPDSCIYIGEKAFEKCPFNCLYWDTTIERKIVLSAFPNNTMMMPCPTAMPTITPTYQLGKPTPLPTTAPTLNPSLSPSGTDCAINF